MEAFLEVALTFPTLVFSIVLSVAIIYWLLAVLGLVEADASDGLLAHDGGNAVHPEAIAGLLMKFGLGGVPVSLVATVLIFTAWLFSYFADYLILQPLSGGLIHAALGFAVLTAAFLAAIPVTSFVLRPLRNLFAKLRPAATRTVLGQVATVRSATVSPEQGTAALEDGGAGLILQVRSETPAEFRRGDRVVLIEYIAARHVYRVVAEDEFKGI